MTALGQSQLISDAIGIHGHNQITSETIRCEQIVHATTGEEPLWVSYDSTVIAAVVHLWHPTQTARYMLGVAGYRHCRNVTTGEVWACLASTQRHQR